MQYMILGIIIALIALTLMIQRSIDMSQEEKIEVYRNSVEKIKGYILDLIFDAEKLYQSGTGQFKKAYVINLILNGEFYKGLPSYVQKMVSFSVLSELVDKIVDTVFNVAKKSNKAVQERLDEQVIQ